MPRLAPLGLELGADHVEIDVLRAGDIDTSAVRPRRSLAAANSRFAMERLLAYRSVNSGLVFGYRERELAHGR
jgi:hypothetical protein